MRAQHRTRRLRLWAYHLLYAQLAWAYDSVSWLVSFGQWDAWRRLALDYVQGDAILEIGFGTGELLVAARKRGLKVVGLERSLAMQAQAQQKLRAAGYVQPLLCGDVQHMPFAAHSFDTILSTFPAEFILAAETWAELHRLLRPGGRVVIVGIVVYLDHPLQRFLARMMPGGKPSREWQRCVELAEAVGFSVSVEVRAARWSRAPVFIGEKSGER